MPKIVERIFFITNIALKFHDDILGGRNAQGGTSPFTARGLAVPHAIAAVCADSGRAFFLRTAAEINVISNPTGNGSMNVISTL